MDLFLGILFAIITTIVWTSLHAFSKYFRTKKKYNSLSVLIIEHIYLAPIWILILIGSYFFLHFHFSKIYFSLIMLWVIFNFLTGLGIIYLLKKITLIEEASFMKGFVLFANYGIDIIFFQLRGNIFIFLSILLTFIGGFLYGKMRKEDSFNIKKLLTKTIPLFFIISIISAIKLMFYKKALILQNTPLEHAIFANLTMSLFYVIIYLLFYIPKKRYFYPKELINLKIIYFLPFIILACFLESFTYNALPISFVAIISSFSYLLNYLFDWLIFKEIKPSKKLFIPLLFFIGSIITYVLGL